MTAAADPNAVRCADCGHVWFAGERRHVRVNAQGQAVEGDGEGDGDSDVVCLLCQRVRERADAEHGGAGETSAPERWTWG